MFSRTVKQRDIKEQIISSIPSIVEQIFSNPDDYYNVQKSLYTFFNTGVSNGSAYHPDFINFLTIGTFAYLILIKALSDKRNEYLSSYLKNLLELQLMDDCLYNAPNCRKWITY